MTRNVKACMPSEIFKLLSTYLLLKVKCPNMETENDL
jgi:hypothetical protein